MSIPHFEDLTPDQIYSSLNLLWWPSEKLDGSFLRAGLDEDGFFYVQRKSSADLIRSADEWPDECWCKDYKLATTVATVLIETLVEYGLISPGQYLGLEVLSGERPNSIFYNFGPITTGLIYITDPSFELPQEVYKLLDKSLALKFSQRVPVSKDGKNIEIENQQHQWKVLINPQGCDILVRAKLSYHASLLKTSLNNWFQEESSIAGLSKKDILEINLKTKHPQIKTNNWNHARSLISKERDHLRGQFKEMIMPFKDLAIRAIVNDPSGFIGPASLKEGVVITTMSFQFKLVERENFTALNLFTHRIKYMIVGGRRPRRSSFLSRTAGWEIEDRLTRLDQLLERYLRNRHKLRYSGFLNGKQITVRYDYSLHERTLGMFADTRKRILNGQ